MKSFKKFLENLKTPKPEKEDRKDRFKWDIDHIEIHPKKKLDEKTYSHPDHDSGAHPEHLPHHDQFKAHGEHINKHHEKKHLAAIHRYKEDSSIVNDHLRSGKKPHAVQKEITHHLDHVTSHKTTKDMHVYRGADQKHHDWHNLKPGTEFTDHGYTSTTLSHNTASEFGDRKILKHGVHDKHHIFKIHLPAGTKAHHFDHHENESDHEHEVVLHRGTKFKVTHHSTHGNHHYIHATVVGQRHED